MALCIDNLFIQIFVFPVLSEWEHNRKSTFYQSMNNCLMCVNGKNKKKYWLPSNCKLLGLRAGGWICFLPEKKDINRMFVYPHTVHTHQHPCTNAHVCWCWRRSTSCPVHCYERVVTISEKLVWELGVPMTMSIPVHTSGHHKTRQHFLSRYERIKNFHPESEIYSHTLFTRPFSKEH